MGRWCTTVSMDERKNRDSTQQLIAEAERLAKPSKDRGVQSTRQIVAQSEKMLGKTSAGTRSLWRWIIAAVIVAAVLGLARLLWR